MRESAYKRISELRIKLATIICDKLNGKFEQKSKDKLINILAKIGISNYYPIVYEYATNHEESCDAISALAQFDVKETFDYFFERLKDLRTLHRDLIIECLGNLKKKELVDKIKPFLKDEDRQVRFQAIYALYNIGGKEAALAMCEYISDPDEWISMTILRLLCKMKELDTIPILIDKYHADTDLRRKALMISFLSRFKSITLLSAFDDALEARDARLRANAIEAIGDLKLSEEDLLKRIVPYLNDPNNRIRANAILAMAKIKPEKVKAQIIDMCNSDDVQLRRSAAFILCMIPPQDFFAQAEKLIVDDNETVRKRMIQSLKNFPHEFISNNINKVLSDKNKWIRKYAVDMIASIPAFETAPIINLLKTERAAPNIEACLKFLASHPDEKAMNSLKIHFKDKRLPVVKSLLKALVSIGGIEEVKNVAPRLEQHDPFVIQSITAIMLESGDLNSLDELIERFEKVRSQNHIELMIPSIESIVDMIVKGDKMPPKLLKALTGETGSDSFNPNFGGFGQMQQPNMGMQPNMGFQPNMGMQPNMGFQPNMGLQPNMVPQPPTVSPYPQQAPVQNIQPNQPIPQNMPDMTGTMGMPGMTGMPEMPDLTGMPGMTNGSDIQFAQQQNIQPDMNFDQSNNMNANADSPSAINLESAIDMNNLNLDLNIPTDNQNVPIENMNVPVDNQNIPLANQGIPANNGEFSLPTFQDLDMLNMAGKPEGLIKKKPSTPHFKAGLKAYNLGKYPKALEEFNKSITSNENPPKTIDVYMGIILCDQGEYKQAIDHLTAFLKETPDNAKANFLLGKCYRKTKDWQKVIDTYQLFIQGEIEATPNMKKRIHQDMGIACAILGKNETAIRLLSNLFKLEPDNAEIGYYLAMAQYKMGKKSEAAATIENAQKVAPAGKPLEKQIANLSQTIRSGLPLN